MYNNVKIINLQISLRGMLTLGVWFIIMNLDRNVYILDGGLATEIESKGIDLSVST